jgi:hypothetical protein
MSESRVRENRMHGSMRRREATPDQSAPAARSEDASRRPYNGAVPPTALEAALVDDLRALKRRVTMT